MSHYPPRQFLQMTPPAFELVTLAEVKLFLRIDGSEEDRLIADLIAMARQQAEQWLRRSFVTQSWKMQQSYSACDRVALSLGPVQSVTSVTAIRHGVETVLATSDYVLDVISEEIAFSAVPSADQLEVVFSAGYGDVGDVAKPIIQAILHLIAHYYENRELNAEIPPIVRQLLMPYRKVSL